MTLPTIEPCPFCKCLCVEGSDISKPDLPHSLHQMTCIVCGVSGPTSPEEAEAIRLWNTLYTKNVADTKRIAKLEAVISLTLSEGDRRELGITP